MIDSVRFREMFLTRLARIIALGAASAPLAAGVGCGGNVVVDVLSGAGGQGGQGGHGGASPTFTVSTGPITNVTSGPVSVSTGSIPEIACFAWPNDQSCPSAMEAYSYITFQGCGGEILGEGTHDATGSCCYPVKSYTDCSAGRPFLVNDRPAIASSQRGRAGAWTDSMALPLLASLSTAERAQLAQAWTNDALAEHASIAAFSRFSLELMAVGAPADLIALAHAAAMDEARHARLCFTLASAYRGEPVVPAPFPFAGSVSVGGDLAALAATTVKEGCIGETLAAFHAAEQLESATDPAVRSVLSAIALDEARHSELAWRTVAWALREGGADVKRAVVDAFAAAEHCVPAARLDTPQSTVASEHLAAHGRPHPAKLRAALARTLQQVILPCAKALLGDTPDGAVVATV